MKTIMIAAGIVAIATSGLPAGQVWHSTFDSDYDGVVQFQSAPPSGEDMLSGGVSGGEAMVHIPQLGTREAGNLYVKSGRALIAEGTYANLTTSHSALYRFRWTALYEGDQGSIPGEGAMSSIGFIRSGIDWPQQSDLVVQMVNYKKAATGDYWLRPYALAAGNAPSGSGGTYTSGPFWMNLGPDPFSQTYHLVIAYDHTTREQTVGLYDEVGNPLLHAGGGPAVFSFVVPAVVQANFDYLGWESDANTIGGTTNITAQDWAVNDLMYFDDATSAFNYVPEPATALLVLTGVLIAGGRRRR
jgi:hypothetical protein